MVKNVSVLAPVLRSETQARVLAALLLRPEREASISDLAREVGSDPGNVHTEVQRLVDVGVLTDRRVGRTRLVRDAHSPLAKALAGLLLIGYGPKVKIEQALTRVPGIDAAFIGGSWAARYAGESGPFPNDVDVIVIGYPDRDDVTEAVGAAVRPLGQQAQVVVRTPEAWAEAADPFTRTAQSQPLVPLQLGAPSE